MRFRLFLARSFAPRVVEVDRIHLAHGETKRCAVLVVQLMSIKPSIDCGCRDWPDTHADLTFRSQVPEGVEPFIGARRQIALDDQVVALERAGDDAREAFPASSFASIWPLSTT